MEQQVNTNALPQQSISTFTFDYFSNEIEKLETATITARMEALSDICKEYDPFAGTKLTEDQESFLREINMFESLSNPFTFTNHALQVLDLLERELKKRSLL